MKKSKMVELALSIVPESEQKQAQGEGDDVLLLTYQEIERFVALVAEKEREAIRDEWHSCVMSDLEHGVKCLNEKAAQDWHKNYPAQSKMFPKWMEARGKP